MEVKRDYYLKELIDRIDNGLIKIITEIRRCGKSQLLNKIFKNYLIEQGTDKEHILQLSLDEYKNKKFLSSDIVTEFRGRGDEIRVYPLSFAEFYSVYDGTEEKALSEYYTFGGLHLTVLAKTDNSKINYLKVQEDNVYINDIIDRNKIQNKEGLEMLVQIIASDIGCLTNPLKLSNNFKERDLQKRLKNIILQIWALEIHFQTLDKEKKYLIQWKMLFIQN